MKTNYLLVDFENVQPEDMAFLKGEPYKMTVFTGVNQKIGKIFEKTIQSFGPNTGYFKVQGNGKNALDFHIAYELGRLTTRFPHAKFYIISNDKGFDPLIEYLKLHRVYCQRIPVVAHVAQLPPAKKASKQNASPQAKKKTPSKKSPGRPAKKTNVRLPK